MKNWHTDSEMKTDPKANLHLGTVRSVHHPKWHPPLRSVRNNKYIQKKNQRKGVFSLIKYSKMNEGVTQ